MAYDDLISSFLNNIPQIRPMIEEEMEWLQEELPHVLFGIVVTPFIIKEFTGK